MKSNCERAIRSWRQCHGCDRRHCRRNRTSRLRRSARQRNSRCACNRKWRSLGVLFAA